MKKTILLSAFILGTITVSAQETALVGNNLGDNWSVGITTGASTKMTHNAFIKGMRPLFGLEVSKQVTPILGIGVQGLGYIKSTDSPSMIDATDLSLSGRINLMNLFAGYEGMPRNFEIETNTGLGWLHYYAPGDGDSNSLSARMGLNFNVNLGESKAWTMSFRPALMYDIMGDFPARKANFNLNHARFEMSTSFIYHFGNSNGERFMTLEFVADPMEIEAMNDEINQLRALVLTRDAELAASVATIAELEDEMNSTPTAIISEEVDICMPECVVAFRQGMSVIDMTQEANLERIANFLKENSDVVVNIKGYASPEGSAEFNQKLSAERAEAVKKLLVEHYGIAEERISTEGLGVGDIFSEPEWNRVSICTMDAAE